MKTNVIFMLMMLVVVLAQAQQKSQRFAIKSGYVKYELTGSTTGTRTVYWDNYGDKSRTETKSKTVTKIFGMTSEDETNTITVMIKDKYWTANLKENKGSKGTVPYYGDGKQFAESMTEKEQKEFADQLLASLGGQKLGTEDVMGYKCDVVEVLGCKSWIHKGIVLKSDAKVLGIVSNEKAVEFKPETSVASSKFDPLSSVSYEDIDALQQQQMGNLNDMFGAMSDMNTEENDADDDDEKTVPVKYPYEKFQKVVNDFSHNDFKKLLATSVEGQHMCTFMKGLQNSVSVIATSRQNSKEEGNDQYEHFTHNGKKCMYGTVEDNSGTALIVEYANYDMYIILAAAPGLDKKTLLEISDKLKF